MCLCSGEAVLEGTGLVPLAIKKIKARSAAEEAAALAEVDALKAVVGRKHIVQLVAFKLTDDRRLCYIITRWAAELPHCRCD